MSSDLHTRVVKLKGRENYDTWKIAAKSYLVIKDLWNCIEKEPDPAKAKEVQLDLKAWSELNLLIHENIFSYVVGTDTAQAAWKNLEKSFEDSGLCRKVELLKQLVQMTLDNSDSVEDYVNKMVTTSLKVEKGGLTIGDELLASLMLAGLPEQFKPLVMSIENATAKLSSDAVKTFLLQETRLTTRTHSNGAYSVRSKSVVFKFRCHHCGEFGHMAKACEEKRKEQSIAKDEKELHTKGVQGLKKTGF